MKISEQSTQICNSVINFLQSGRELHLILCNVYILTSFYYVFRILRMKYIKYIGTFREWSKVSVWKRLTG